jgi:hypothetical protein
MEVGVMKMRGNLGRGTMALVLCLTITLAGCSTAWITEAEQIVAALIPAAANLVALVAALQGTTVSAADLQTIQNAGTQAGADLQLIQSLINAYQQADTSAQPGILNQIQSAINAVESNLQGLLPALHIKDAATQAKITAVVGILLSEVQSLAAVVPFIQGSGAAGQVYSSIGSRIGSPTLAQQTRKDGAPSFVKAPLSAREFVASYNATMTAKTGNAELDRTTARLKIHEHGKLARWATAGWLK